MADYVNHDLEFLSDQKLVNVLQSALKEIEAVALIGANRSTTFLAMSAIEGLFGEILKLKHRTPEQGHISKVWPKWGTKLKPLDKTSLSERYRVLQAERLLPKGFAKVFEAMIAYRNYMHPDREMKNLEPIELSVAQRALSYLNAVIEMYAPLRFAAGAEWELIDGQCGVSDANAIRMPNAGYGRISMLITKLPTRRFRELTFYVIIPPEGIFNFVYNFVSERQFMAARIEGRVRPDGKGLDSGRLVCESRNIWNIDAHYSNEPDPTLETHTVEIRLPRSGPFDLVIDGVSRTLQGSASWDFDPNKRIGFVTEIKPLSVGNLQIKTR